MPKVPATTNPLTKFVRTLEGWLVLAANTALLIVPIVTTVSPSYALKLAVILNGVVLIARTILKAVASFSPIVGPPITPGSVVGATDSSVDSEVALALVTPTPETDAPPESAVTPDKPSGE